MAPTSFRPVTTWPIPRRAQRFTAAYGAKQQIRKDGDNKAVLVIGAR